MGSHSWSLFSCCMLVIFSTVLGLKVAPSVHDKRRGGRGGQKTFTCPGVCRPGKTGFISANKDCAGARCEQKRVKCTIQACLVDNSVEGFKCDCPVTVDSCPNQCRTGAIGKVSAIVECRQKPTCFDGSTRCRLQRCFIDGERGVECSCPELTATEEPDI